MSPSWINDLEYELMNWCLRARGKWWANHFFRNREVNVLYFVLRKNPPSNVCKIIEMPKSFADCFDGGNK